MAIGKNDPCWCGKINPYTGRVIKYKKCHLIKDIKDDNSPTFLRPKLKEIRPTQELIKIKELTELEHKKRRPQLERLGIYIDFVIPVISKGVKYWALGERLYYRWNVKETFHEFIMDTFAKKLGEKWRDEQMALPDVDRHFIFKCYEKYFAWQKTNRTSEYKVGDLWAALPNGYTRSLLSLAFDVCSLMHKVHLPSDLLERLKNKAEYQGARQEIGISAVFARLGYKIDFLNEKYIGKKNTPNHPEFNAINEDNNETISVEVKSKHHDGVLHFGGISKPEELIKGNVMRAYRQGLKQNPGGKPFLIFIDVNAPLTPGIKGLEKPWIKDIMNTMKKYPIFSRDRPDPCTGIIFTNFSYHYQEENQALTGESFYSIPLYSKFNIKDSNFFSKLNTALSNYGNVPNLDIEISLP